MGLSNSFKYLDEVCFIYLVLYAINYLAKVYLIYLVKARKPLLMVHQYLNHIYQRTVNRQVTGKSMAQRVDDYPTLSIVCF